MLSFKIIGLLLLQKILEIVTIYGRGGYLGHVIWTYKLFVPPSHGGSIRNFATIGQWFSEIFENGGQRRKVPKFSDTKNLCCNLPNIQTKRPNLGVFCQNDAKGIANSEDPDQTAPLGAV